MDILKFKWVVIEGFTGSLENLTVVVCFLFWGKGEELLSVLRSLALSSSLHLLRLGIFICVLLKELWYNSVNEKQLIFCYIT